MRVNNILEQVAYHIPVAKEVQEVPFAFDEPFTDHPAQLFLLELQMNPA